MRKNFLMALAAVTMLASCQKNDGGKIDSERTLKVTFNTSPGTRAVEDPGTADITDPSITSATIYFLKVDGTTPATYLGGSFVFNTSNIAEATSTGYRFEAVTTDVAYIKVTTNTGDITGVSNINDFQNAETTHTAGFKHWKQMEGIAPLTLSSIANTDEHPLYEAKVELRYALTRLEIIGGIDATPTYTKGVVIKDNGQTVYEIKKSDGTYRYNTSNSPEPGDKSPAEVAVAYERIQTGYYSAEVMAIYINNVKLTYGAATPIWVSTTNWGTQFAMSGTHQNMFDVLTEDQKEDFGTATTATDGSWWWTAQTAAADRNKGIVNNKAAAYQIFPQSTKATDATSMVNELPHVIVKLSVKETATSTAKDVYLNLRLFQEGSSNVTDFKGSNIYRLNLNNISAAFNNAVKITNGEVIEDPTTTDPDPAKVIDLLVKVEVFKWTLHNITSNM